MDIFGKGCGNRGVGVERWKFDGGMETGEGRGSCIVFILLARLQYLLPGYVYDGRVTMSI